MSTFADIILTNANVFTADDLNPSAQAVALRGSRIAFVGSTQDAQTLIGPDTRIIDAGGRTLMPGFIDSHFHMFHGSLNLDRIAFEVCETYQDAAKAILDFAAANPAAPWLTGFGLRYNLGPGNIPLTRQHLDAILADRPIAITAYDGHTTWVNTLGLRTAGIFNGAECPANSEVVLDENGEATGELKEYAARHIDRHLPEPDPAAQRRLLKQGLQLASSMGVTSVHNMDGTDEQAALYALLEEAGELSVRVYMPYSIRVETPFEAIAAEAFPLKEKYQTEMLRCGCVKLFMDGVIETHTGLLVEPYTDQPDTLGASNFDLEAFNRAVAEADRLGLQIFVHSVGDGGVRRVLDAYELAQRQNGKRDSRHRIEHIEVIHPADLHRFKELGVIASMQPLHAPASAETHDIWPSRVGLERWGRSFAWRTLRQAGAVLAFGSDWPVVSQNPMLGVHMALNRLPWAPGLPDQRQTLTETLLSYTRDAAYAEFQEYKKGQLRPGYLADLVLLSEDLFQLPAEQMQAVQPLLTIVNGRVVYEAAVG